MAKLMLIDGMAAVYRAYYALNRAPRLNSKGLNTSAILGFTTTLYDLLRQQAPTHVGVAFDLSAPTFRHELYTDYKANRDAMPEDIQQALPYIHQIISAFNIPILTCQGYEADDVIGTLSHAAEREGFDEVLMVSPDKDFGQLVTDRVHLYRFGRMGNPDTIMGVAEVNAKFGIDNPLQVIDLLGIWGDASDNIPGIKGIGEKGAQKLIAQFGSIENMVANADQIKNDKTRTLVQQQAQDALFSKQLATIALDAPIAFDPQTLERHTPDYAKLKQLFDELEFRTFAKRFFTDLSVTDPDTAMQVFKAQPAAPAADPKGSARQPLQTSLFDEPASPSLQTEAQQQDSAVPAAATAAPTVDAVPEADAFAILVDHSTSDKPVLAVYTPDGLYINTLDGCDADSLRRLLENPDALMVCHDLKQLYYDLLPLGIHPAGKVVDVQLMHYLLNPEVRHTIPFMASELWGENPETTAQCAKALWDMAPHIYQQLEQDDLVKLYEEVELPLVDVLFNMEREGVRIDVQALHDYSVTLTAERDALATEIYGLAGSQFNISSPRQLGEVLYEQLKITDKPPLTPTKQYSTSEDVLQKLKQRHPIVEKILDYRSLSKLIGTYLDSFPQLINPKTGRLHTMFNQTVTATGRLSSSNPNLQNIPIRTERGREMRKAFVPRNADYIILAADYSQIELRIIASLSGDRNMCEAFANHQDIHAATAARIYKLPIDEVAKEQRRNAKSVNFGIVYGISAFGLAEQLGIPRKEAAALIEGYFEQYPDIKRFIDASIASARENGFAHTLLGRRRYLPDINSRNNNLRSFAERNAVNMPIQGTSADMIKIAMVNIYKQFKAEGLQSKMILQVHDELVFDVYKPELDKVRSIVEQAMLKALPLRIPIEVGIDVGNNWLDAH
ncbi:MAG: DNA polymerase I [Bacteroidales bacterium]|nr:DNA polymerase I [Bacteroidales bacterium]